MLTDNSSAPALSTTPGRFYALDAARAFALLIGIFHHGIESFVSYAKWDWATQDTQQSMLLDVLFYVSHVFRMQAFFLMSGFFAHLLYHRRGSRAFSLNRAKRLLLPFLLFWPVLYQINRQIWLWGIQRISPVSYQQAMAKLPTYMVWSNGFPLMHLWFLYLLLLFCLAVVLVRPVVDRWLDPGQRIRLWIDQSLSIVMTRWWGSLAIGVLMVGPMLGMTDQFGVDTSASGLVPLWAPFLLYGFYFTLGWFLHRQSRLIAGFHTFKLMNLILSVLLILTLILVSLFYDEIKDSNTAKFVFAGLNILYAFASITTVSAFIGYVMAYFSDPDPRIRYLSDAAYWGYLVHLPLVASLQVLVAPYDWIWPIKLLLILGPTCLILWLTYQYGRSEYVAGKSAQRTAVSVAHWRGCLLAPVSYPHKIFAFSKTSAGGLVNSVLTRK